ncbi:SURF1 family protein [Streptomyces mayteni]
MYRFLLTPRWWAINVFVLLAIPVCLVAGMWQLGRFEDQVANHREQQERAERGPGDPRPLAELLPLTTETVGEQAEARGTFDVDGQLLVPGRQLEGELGFYVLTPLLPADGGPAVPVVRGWLPGEADPAAVPAAPAGEVTVVGALQAAESPSKVDGPTEGLPAGQLGVISAASLINVLSYPVGDPWITVTDAVAPMTPVPAVAPTGTGLDMDAFQNLGYTAEWFVFAAFVVFMWFRLVRREVEARQDAELALVATGEPGSGPGPGAAPEPEPDVTVEPAGVPARTGSPAPPA